MMRGIPAKVAARHLPVSAFYSYVSRFTSRSITLKVTDIKSMSIQGEDNRGYFIVNVDTDVGIYGLGEAGNRYFGSSIEKAVERLSEIVSGQDPFGTERLWQHMFRGSFFPADGAYSCAISAIEIALSQKTLNSWLGCRG